MVRTASTPVILGIEISVTITSGCNLKRFDQRGTVRYTVDYVEIRLKHCIKGLEHGLIIIWSRIRVRFIFPPRHGIQLRTAA